MEQQGVDGATLERGVSQQSGVSLESGVSLAKQLKDFTVQCPPKIERIEEKASKKKSRTSIWLSLLKWLFTVLMFLATLGCLIMSKVRGKLVTAWRVNH